MQMKYKLIIFLLTLLSIIIIPIFSFLLFGPVWAIFIFISYIVLIELSFRFVYRLITGTSWTIIPKIPFHEIYVEPHPYLPYAYKKNFITQKPMPSTYRLHKDKGYMFGQYRTNSMRYINGIGGSREILIPKPEKMIRINCLGESTTQSKIQYKGQEFSYPEELEKILQKQFPSEQIEVNNCSGGGRTSADILIEFELINIDTRPDIVILYFGHNDLMVSLTPDFQSDYFHARKSFGEDFFIYRWSSILPDLPLASYNFMKFTVFGGNIRFTLLDSISRGTVDIKSAYQGMPTIKRNIEHIISICKANDIQIILSTFSHFLDDSVKDNPRYQKFHEGVILLNNVIREVAKTHDVAVIDNFNLIPQDERYFVDSQHFSPEGMQLIASNISVPVIHFINNIVKK